MAILAKMVHSTALDFKWVKPLGSSRDAQAQNNIKIDKSTWKSKPDSTTCSQIAPHAKKNTPKIGTFSRPSRAWNKWMEQSSRAGTVRQGRAPWVPPTAGSTKRSERRDTGRGAKSRRKNAPKRPCGAVAEAGGTPAPWDPPLRRKLIHHFSKPHTSFRVATPKKSAIAARRRVGVRKVQLKGGSTE